MLASKNRERGKRNEAALAKILNGKRIGLLGMEDIEHHRFSFEVKSYQRYAGGRVMEQAERNAPEDKIPIAIVHEKNKRHNGDLVLMRLNTFLELTEEVPLG